ncbi:MAG: site-2 protease family protein [candidate division WOR-3 bacterium]|nr:site-2 protease family protein [candidate division WOR-3 bacterium]
MHQETIDYLQTKMFVLETIPLGQSLIAYGRLYEPVEKTIEEIKAFCKEYGYIPFFSQEGIYHKVMLGPMPEVVDKPRIWLNVLLFVATIFTTLLAGSFNSGGNPLENFSDITLGIPFSFSIMAILTFHELGHYFVSKKYGLVTSLPYFIPVPFHFLGTFGAIIRMKSIVPSRRALLRIGMAGPFSGFLIALLVSIFGLGLSEVRPAPATGNYLRLGDSLLFYILARIIHPVIPEGSDIFLHPMAFAGWIGFLVTSMNLMPIGQLDGGHIAYSVLLKNQKKLYLPVMICLIGFGILWQGWIIWGLLAFILARREPLIQDAITPLSRKEKIYAIIALLILVLTFIPQPFSIF